MIKKAFILLMLVFGLNAYAGADIEIFDLCVNGVLYVHLQTFGGNIALSPKYGQDGKIITCKGVYTIKKLGEPAKI
jgi:hypothetical protein